MELLRTLEGIRTPFLDTLIGLITMLGEETLLIVIVCAIFWCINKRAGYRIGIAFFLASLTVQGMKICFRIERPWVIDETFTPVSSAIGAATGYSFPSGHTQTATSIFAGIGSQIKNKPAKAVCFIIPFLVAFSRMYLGVHTLLDVSVAIIISAVFVFIAARLFTQDEINKKREMILPLILFIYAAAWIAVTIILWTGGKIEYHSAADSMKAIGAVAGFALGAYIERVYINYPVESKNVPVHIIKLVLGLAGLLAIKEGLKPVFGLISDAPAFTAAADAVRYSLIGLWVTVFYPLVIKKFFARGGLPAAQQHDER